MQKSKQYDANEKNPDEFLLARLNKALRRLYAFLDLLRINNNISPSKKQSIFINYRHNHKTCRCYTQLNHKTAARTTHPRRPQAFLIRF